MSVTDNTRIVIDPKQLLQIEVLDETGDGSKEYLTFLCRYLPIATPQGPKVGFELLYEPSGQGSNAPISPYDVAHSTIERLVVDPRRLKHVRPYVTA